jgi:hypothetical protein
VSQTATLIFVVFFDGETVGDCPVADSPHRAKISRRNVLIFLILKNRKRRARPLLSAERTGTRPLRFSSGTAKE